MRGAVGLVIIMLLSATAPVALASSPPASRPTTTATTQPLDPVIPVAEFRGISMEKAVETLRDMTKVNIVVRWPTLKEAGVERSSPVDLRVTRLPLQRVLELLGDVGGAAAASNVELAAREDRGVVILSTRDDLESGGTTLRLYDVRDLVESDMAVRSRVSISQAATMPTTQPTPEERYGESLDQLNRVIEETIDPESWRDAGGTIGSIQDFNGMLIISHTPANHARIAKLLEELRRK
jgi:hypothetical protein